MTAPRLSVIVPAHRSPHDLERCITALRASDLRRHEWELVVVDDGSTDEETTRVALAADRVITLPAPAGGPARARNAGAVDSSAPLVAFVDADVLVHPDALRRIVEAFGNPTIDAVFGSYDDTPAHPGIVSEYRNLLHHRVHQSNAGDVESFWAGCGAIRRDVLESAGMFDENRYRRPEIEDVELGYRLRDAGHRTVLDPAIQCTHLKRWTLAGMISSDFTRRGLPWARLLVERQMLLSPRGLSLGAGEQASAALAAATIVTALGAIFLMSANLAIAALVFFAIFAIANYDLLSWLRDKRGAWFAAFALPLHFIYTANALASLIAGATVALVSRRS
ncbi:MAG: glycosyltransferase [Gemmatimonadaceae bacterium]